jgi:hypothetical protein
MQSRTHINLATKPPTSYCSLLGNSSSPSFDDIGTSAYVYFVRWHNATGNGGGHNRDLLRVPVRISVEK